ncbi:hypothetical protein CV945_16985 [Geobacillus sp. Manikaran-105]|nr:hypothetical protein CV945_16985 [Geobacillus sp. Manikaran-105]
MLVHREHLLGLFVSLLTFYRKGALFSISFGFYWIINTPALLYLSQITKIGNLVYRLIAKNRTIIPVNKCTDDICNINNV